MKMVDGKAVEEWTTGDVAALAKELGYSLTANEKKAILEQLCKKYDSSQVNSLVKNLIVFMKNTNTDEKPADPARWYYHSKDKNETKTAIAAALDAARPLLIYAGKPGCSVCELVWKTHLKATGKMADWLRENRVVGLKIDDTSLHFSNLSTAKNKYTGIDGISGKKVNSTAPFFVFVKLKETARGKTKITLDSSKGEVETFLSGYGSGKAGEKTYEKVTAWLESLMSSGEFKRLF